MFISLIFFFIFQSPSLFILCIFPPFSPYFILYYNFLFVTVWPVFSFSFSRP
jgi:hypothetical protein